MAKQVAKHSALKRLTLAAAASLSRSESSPLPLAPWRCGALAADYVGKAAAPYATTSARRAAASTRRFGASPCTAAQRSIVLRVVRSWAFAANLMPRLTLAAAASTSDSG